MSLVSDALEYREPALESDSLIGFNSPGMDTGGMSGSWPSKLLKNHTNNRDGKTEHS